MKNAPVEVNDCAWFCELKKVAAADMPGAIPAAACSSTRFILMWIDKPGGLLDACEHHVKWIIAFGNNKPEGIAGNRELYGFAFAIVTH